ncbi:c-type cytochrome [Paraburkholderia sp. RL17-337-BIB-A]|uniref:c-type cytochrome n=1 Tax=Paraburkholderia sp. RL17-337-BIB-A TaxID=3031636 RepID=UPI0038B7B0D1
MLDIIKRFNVRNSDNRTRAEHGRHEKVGSYLRHVLSRGAQVGLVASLGAFASLCFAQSQAATASTNNVAQGPSIATCVACHGALGAGSEMGMPRLAGRNPEYLAHALSMFKAGTRVSPQMQAVAQNLSDSDMRALAVFFSNQHPPLVKASQPPAPELVAAGKQLAEVGAGTSVLACFSCHAAGGKGDGARFPTIAGEPAAFTVARLHEFQARAKASPPKAGTMTAVAATLNDTQIEQVAAYLSVTGP